MERVGDRYTETLKHLAPFSDASLCPAEGAKQEHEIDNFFDELRRKVPLGK